MTVGETYALSGHRRIKVTYLDTPPEVRAQRRVRVRFETGVTAGRVNDVPTVRIAGPWDRQAVPPSRKPPAQRPSRGPRTVARRARPGDVVVLAQTGELAWTVVAIDEDAGEATIVTEIFGQPDTRTAALDSLQVRVPEPPLPAPSLPAPKAHASDASGETAEEAVARIRPVTPRRELDELMDDVLFTLACLEQYARRLGSCTPGVANERLRDEVRRAGFILRDENAAGEYARIRVLGRFDIVLPHHPSPETPVHVDRLRLAARKGRRGSGGHRRAA
jgi:hypothetical protein